MSSSVVETREALATQVEVSEDTLSVELADGDAVMQRARLIKLPEEILGYKVPGAAQQWVDRNAQIGEYGKQTQAGFQTISDSVGKR